MKKIVAFILVLALLSVSIVSVPVYADEYSSKTTEYYYVFLEWYLNNYGVTNSDGYKTFVDIQYYGEYKHYYTMENRGNGIYFELFITADSDTYFISSTEFILYKSSRNITVDFLMMYMYYGKIVDYTRGTKSIDITTYSPDNTYHLNYSGNLLTYEQATKNFNDTLALLCLNMDIYIYEELGVGLEELGFRNFPGLGDPVCDLVSNYHVGYADVKNASDATCTKNGYTGDVYCTYCGKLAYEGEIIYTSGHSYDNNNDLICNNCGYERPPYIIGDCNGDHNIDTTDLAILKLNLAGINELTASSKLGADLNEDGNVDTTDLAVLKLLLAGITTPSQPSHTHLYTKRIINPTCTQQGYSIYTCSCGDTYSTDYVEPAHNYKNNVCTVCGNNENYNLYLTEYNELTADYNSKVSELESKIAKCNENIENCQTAINNARGTLATLSPSCPQWFLQEYINNWQAYGSTGAATQAAQNAWSQQYNSQVSQLNNTISTNTSIIQSEQQNIRLYTSAISTLTTQYNNNVDSLKLKYGID